MDRLTRSVEFIHRDRIEVRVVNGFIRCIQSFRRRLPVAHEVRPSPKDTFVEGGLWKVLDCRRGPVGNRGTWLVRWDAEERSAVIPPVRGLIFLGIPTWRARSSAQTHRWLNASQTNLGSVFGLRSATTAIEESPAPVSVPNPRKQGNYITISRRRFLRPAPRSGAREGNDVSMVVVAHWFSSVAAEAGIRVRLGSRDRRRGEGGVWCTVGTLPGDNVPVERIPRLLYSGCDEYILKNQDSAGRLLNARKK